MKLIECYVENFGKLSGYTHSFTDGLNLIIGNNGCGKTTLSVFIKAMLYGLDQKKQKGEETDRKRYFPWQGGRCGGSLTFENDGKIYRIERTFKERASQDTFAVYDAKTGALSQDFTEKVGEELFEIDADGFERTVFLSEKNLSVKGNSTISTKLSNLVGVNGDMGSYAEAIATLEKKEKALQHRRGNGGVIGDLKSDISTAEAELYEIKKKKEVYKAAEASLSRMQKEAEKAEAERKSIEKSRLQGEFNKEYAAKLNFLGQAEKKIEAEKEFFKNFLPRKEELAHYEEKKSRASLLIQTIADERRILDSEFVDDSEEIEAHIKALSTPLAPKKVNKTYNFALVLAFVTFAIGILLGTVSSPFLFAVCPISLIFLAIYFSKKKSAVGDKEEPDLIQNAIEFILSKTGKIPEKEELHSILLGMKAEVLARKRERERISRSIKQKEESVAELSKEYGFFLSSFPTETDEPFAEIRSHLASYEALLSDVAMKKREAERYAFEHGIASNPSEINTEAEELPVFSEEALLNAEAKAKELRAAYFTEESKILALAEDISREDEQRERILELTDSLKKAEFEHKISVKAAEHLTLAKERLTAKYLGKMRTAFDRYASAVCNENGSSFALDTDFTLRKTENGLTNSAESYSLGTRELYSLITRLALIEALYDKTKPFIILDDPFCHFDDTKCALALDTVAKLSKDSQIIYFTCAESRTPD